MLLLLIIHLQATEKVMQSSYLPSKDVMVMNSPRIQYPIQGEVIMPAIELDRACTPGVSGDSLMYTDSKLYTVTTG